jgi:DNA replication protein
MDKKFQGFEEGKKKFSALPDPFFSELLPAIDDLNELKVTVYLLWSAYRLGDFGAAFRLQDILLDEQFTRGLEVGRQNLQQVLSQCLQRAAARGSLIEVADQPDGSPVYFINSPRGRAAAELFRQGQPVDLGAKPTLESLQPNLFQLYEENIGPLTPIIADTLRDAQATYPAGWIEEALQLAVKNNVRRWKYVEGILKRWQEEGKDGANRRDDQEDHRRYLKGEYGDIGQH